MTRKVTYLVTKRPEKIDAVLAELEPDTQVVQVDGTVEGWTPRPGDLIFDHHRDGGADVQIQEILWTLIPELFALKLLVVTPQVDADAIVAAAWLQVGDRISIDAFNRFTAIAYDCDYLGVPPAYAYLAKFAADAVAALKAESDALAIELGLDNGNRKDWGIELKDQYTSHCFERGAQWLMAAANGERPWPGQSGEAVDYWEKMERTVQKLIDENRVSLFRDCLVFDSCKLNERVDPRAWFEAAKRQGLQSKWPVAVTHSEVWQKAPGDANHRLFLGISYRVGVTIAHPLAHLVDFHKQAPFVFATPEGFRYREEMSIVQALTSLERTRSLQSDAWGGRKTVMGSGQKVPSHLPLLEVCGILEQFFETALKSH